MSIGDVAAPTELEGASAAFLKFAADVRLRRQARPRQVSFWGLAVRLALGRVGVARAVGVCCQCRRGSG